MVAMAGSTLLALTLVFALVPARFIPTASSRLAATVPVALLLAPLGGLAPLAYLRGVTGDLSVVSLGMMVGYCSSRLLDRNLIDLPSRTWLVAVSLLSGLALYPSALGLNQLQFYRLGYSPLGMTIACLAVGLLCWYAGGYWFSGCLACAMGGYAVQLLESRNLWDYVVDPMLFAFSFGILVIVLFKRVSTGRVSPKPRRAHEVQ